jgi:hypothetical protein
MFVIQDQSINQSLLNNGALTFPSLLQVDRQGDQIGGILAHLVIAFFVVFF